MVELDTRLSKDGVPIVFHDSMLKRITGKRGALRERSARYLTSLDLGDGYRLSTLEDTLAELTPRIPVNVELKYNDLVEYRPLATEVCAVIKKLGVEQRILISSFHHQALRMVEKLLPGVAVAPLMGCLTGPPHQDDLDSVFERKALRRPAEVYPFAGPAAVVWWPMIDEELAQKFAKAGATPRDGVNACCVLAQPLNRHMPSNTRIKPTREAGSA